MGVGGTVLSKCLVRQENEQQSEPLRKGKILSSRGQKDKKFLRKMSR